MASDPKIKTIRYIGHSTGQEIQHPPNRWIEVLRGETVDLPARLADSYAQQVDKWVIVDVKQKAADAVKDGEG
jgi:hypothetical protein